MNESIDHFLLKIEKWWNFRLSHVSFRCRMENPWCISTAISRFTATFTTDCPVPSDAPGSVDSVVLAKRNSRHSCVTSPETQGVVEKGWNPCEFFMIFLSRFGDWFGLMFRLVVFGHHPSLSKMIEIASTLIIPLFLNAAASNGSKVGTCHTCFETRKIDWAVNRCFRHPLKGSYDLKGTNICRNAAFCMQSNVMYIKSYTRFHLRYLSFLELNNMICESSWLCKCQNNSLSYLWGMFDTIGQDQRDSSREANSCGMLALSV